MDRWLRRQRIADERLVFLASLAVVIAVGVGIATPRAMAGGLPCSNVPLSAGKALVRKLTPGILLPRKIPRSDTFLHYCTVQAYDGLQVDLLLDFHPADGASAPVFFQTYIWRGNVTANVVQSTLDHAVGATQAPFAAGRFAGTRIRERPSAGHGLNSYIWRFGSFTYLLRVWTDAKSHRENLGRYTARSVIASFARS